MLSPSGRTSCFTRHYSNQVRVFAFSSIIFVLISTTTLLLFTFDVSCDHDQLTGPTAQLLSKSQQRYYNFVKQNKTTSELHAANTRTNLVAGANDKLQAGK